jgi:DNA-binding GntR family transcriptional regulator
MQSNPPDPTAADPPSPAGETIAETVRHRVLDAILYGDLATPMRLFPADLARRFNVSITPVREALALLAGDGFIEAIPRRGYHVRLPTQRYIRELWSVRLALELMAGESVLTRLPDPRERRDALAPLHAIHRQLARSGTLPQRTHVALNGQLHDTLVQLSGNELLTTTYHGIRLRLAVAWIQRGSPAWRSRLASEQAEHQAVLDALDRGDPAAFDAALRAHLTRSLGDALRDVQGGAADTQTTKQDKEDDHETDLAPAGGGRPAVGAGRGRARREPDHAQDVDLP